MLVVLGVFSTVLNFVLLLCSLSHPDLLKIVVSFLKFNFAQQNSQWHKCIVWKAPNIIWCNYHPSRARCVEENSREKSFFFCFGEILNEICRSSNRRLEIENSGKHTHTLYDTQKTAAISPPQGILESYNLIKLNICKQLRHALENVLIHSISLTKYELWIWSSDRETP